MGEFSLLAKRLFRRRVVLLAALLLLAIVGTALVLPPLLGIDPNAINVLERLQAPSGKHRPEPMNWGATSACASSGAAAIRS